MSTIGSDKNKQFLYIRSFEPDIYHVEDVIKVSFLAVNAWRVYQTDAGIDDQPREWNLKLEYTNLFRATGSQASSRETFDPCSLFNELGTWY